MSSFSDLHKLFNQQDKKIIDIINKKTNLIGNGHVSYQLRPRNKNEKFYRDLLAKNKVKN